HLQPDARALRARGLRRLLCRNTVRHERCSQAASCGIVSIVMQRFFDDFFLFIGISLGLGFAEVTWAKIGQGTAIGQEKSGRFEFYDSKAKRLFGA
ncbi:MAG TPA: hypothetical protein VLD83_02340, partial [Candidatus Binatia bacterium]|nr:hypothetical protein [Candidatus Binatia bacterium]